MKTKFITMVLTFVIMSFGLSFGQSITLDNIKGIMWHNQPDSMTVGSTYVFTLRLTNNANTQAGITNGFTVSSPDGATWTTTIGDTTGVLAKTQFDLISTVLSFSVTGSGADTVGFAGASLFGSGMVGGFDDTAYTITIGPILGGASAHGKTICLDSTLFESGVWKWAGPSGDVFPTWDGPHCYTLVHELTGVDDNFDGLPNSFALAQNYPNPFNPSTTINYDLPKNSDVTLTIYNVTGQKIKEFSEENKSAGSHSITWNANSVASGIYFYKLVAGDFTDTKKMMLLK